MERFGDTQYPEMIIFSVTFKKFWDWSVRGQWDRFARGIEEALSALAAA
ncbi:MAG TPA: hypothetical protein GX517_05105 [Alicyclobacillus sp.]|nr:hypothetical protein [Alicyclobacillus sp.]